jgi:hypothetical protein
MKNETEFIALDSVMVMVATAALTIFHPEYCFPRLSNSFSKTGEMTESVSVRRARHEMPVGEYLSQAMKCSDNKTEVDWTAITEYLTSTSSEGTGLFLEQS